MEWKKSLKMNITHGTPIVKINSPQLCPENGIIKNMCGYRSIKAETFRNFDNFAFVIRHGRVDNVDIYLK